LRIGIGGTLGLMGIFDEGRSMDYLEVQVETIEEITVVAQLNIQWLVLSVSPFEQYLPEPVASEEKTPLPFDATQLTRVLADARAWDIELDIPVKFTVECLLAVGVRLRGIGAKAYSLLPVLALAAPHCPNLLSLRILHDEQISSQDLEKVASSCPLLEIVCLNADRFHWEPIDDGIRALGRYCSNLRHLDLFCRCMEEPCMSLAGSCSGWPKLEYLCIGEVIQDFQEWDECLPRALAQNCPLLQELIMYPIPSRWRRIMGPSFARLWDREMKMDIQVSAHRSVTSYIQTVTQRLNETDQLEVCFSALGKAIPIASEVAMRLQAAGLMRVDRIQTESKAIRRGNTCPCLLIMLITASARFSSNN